MRLKVGFWALAVGIVLMLCLVICTATPIRPQGQLEEADVFVVLGFGLRKTSDGHDAPGPSNQALAAWVVEHNPEHEPTIVQMGVYLALEELAAQDPGLLPLDDWVLVLPHSAHVNVDTRGAVLQSWVLMEQAGHRGPAVVSHPLQLQRAGWLFTRLPVDRVILPDIQDVPFDPHSIHPQTRSTFHYIPFELTARLVGSLLKWY